MKTFPVARTLGLIALAGTLLPAVLNAFHLLGDDSMRAAMLASTVLWFIAAPLWLKGGDH